MNYYIDNQADEMSDLSTLVADTVSENFRKDEDSKENELKIVEKIYRSWSGVRSCGKQERVESELQAAVEAWVGAKLIEYVNWEVVQYGHSEVAIRTSNGRGSFPDRKRYCNGSLQTDAFIIFRKPV